MTSDSTFHLINHHLSQRHPLSIVRYGDGEAILLNGFKDIDALKSLLKRQFGYVLQIDHAEQVRESLIAALKIADVIGMPQDRHARHSKYWATAKQILAETVDVPPYSLSTTIDVHSEFLDKGYYHKLLTGLETLNYISCRNLDDRFKEVFGIKNVNSFIIAPEAKYTSGYQGDNHYPNQFHQIRKWIDKMDCTGQLCLVGAGVLGKSYTTWFAQRGGIAMDIGSVFDSFAGFVTRGINRGLDATDDTYKL